jgi:hypothetical protein
MYNDDDPIEVAYADYVIAKYMEPVYDTYFETDPEEDIIIAEWESGVYGDD